MNLNNYLLSNNTNDIKSYLCNTKPLKFKSKLTDIRNYIIIFTIIIFEDSPFFTLNNKQTFWFIIFSSLFLFSIKKEQTYNRKIFYLLIAIYLLIIFQYYVFGGGLTPSALYKPFWIFYTPFLVFVLMGFKYFKYLVNVIYFIAIYTTIIYLLQTFIPSVNIILQRGFSILYPYSWSIWPNSLIFYSIPRESGFFFMRNSGIFHEPGAYSIYLVLGIILNTLFTNNTFHWKNVFLAAVIITTFSTTGYIMLFLFSIFAVVRLKVSFYFKPIIIIPFAILLLIIYRDSSFLEEKINQQYSKETESVESEQKGERGRFYSFGMSLKAFSESPFIGRGILNLHKYNIGEKASFGYGFAGLFAMYGIFFGLFYMYFFYKGVSMMSKLFGFSFLYTFICFIIINLGLLTQVFFFHTPFIYFFIIGLFGYLKPVVSKSFYK